jgi:hypothetical protein
MQLKTSVEERTFVFDQPNLNAISFANSSPNPSISPLTKGSNKLIAAPRSNPHTVGGEYRIRGELDEGGDEDDISLFPS